MRCFDAGRWLLDHGVSHIVADIREDLHILEGEDGAEVEDPPENQPIRQDLRSQLSASHRLCVARGVPPEVYRKLGAGYLDRSSRKNERSDPLNHRIVFQIRGLKENETGELQPVVLGQLDPATTEDQAERDGKWWTYTGFKKSLELYSLDHAILDAEAVDQAKCLRRWNPTIDSDSIRPVIPTESDHPFRSKAATCPGGSEWVVGLNRNQG